MASKRRSKVTDRSPIDPLSLAVGRRVAAQREAAKLGQLELATRAGIGLRMLKAIEGGERGVSLKSLAPLAAALDVPPALLLADPTVTDCSDALAQALVLAVGSSETASRVLGRAVATLDAAGRLPTAAG
jgi:transcriptional regulator with XRE-family HTH domain